MLTLVLAACGDSEAPAPSGGEARTVEHKFGTTEVEGAPERVVSLGYTDQDFALALGVTPIATREWFGEQPDATWPWAQDELGDAAPEVLPSADINFEQVAALRPDLILAVYSGISEADYDRLSRIAPTIAQTDEAVDFGLSWQEQLRLTGEALDRSDEAERITNDIEGQFERIRADNPGFADEQALFAYREEAGTFGGYSSQDPRGRFLTALGFQPDEQIDEAAGDAFFASLSGEQVRQLESDVLVMLDLAGVAADRDELLEDPLFRRLDVVRERRDVYPDAETAAALSFSSPLSLPAALEAIVPPLAAAAAK